MDWQETHNDDRKRWRDSQSVEQWLAALEMGRVGGADMTVTEALIVEGATEMK
ncbi:hypothetical protein SESBI_25319 [Sesbania bispinosa]|nr:hypothetical protein SESBI_25319 [Sesbania bispinosa]